MSDESDNNEPDFSEFDDWLIDGPTGKWPDPAQAIQPTEEQRVLVERNAFLLLDRNRWSGAVDRFEIELNKIDNDILREERRKQFHIRFDDHRFQHAVMRLDFSEYRFPCSVSFDRATFEARGVSFDHAAFGHGDVSFDDATFGNGAVRFDDATFGTGNIWFRDVAFGKGKVSFKDATFGEGDVSFNDAAFGEGDVTFVDSTFGDGNVLFANATFGDGDVSFMNTTFGDGNVSFYHAAFGNGDVVFKDATFGNTHVFFHDATFGDGRLWFDDATFKNGLLLFQGTTLGNGDVSFENLILDDGQVWFQNVTLAGGGFWFTPKFTGTTSVFFRDTKIEGNLLVKTHFPGAANFRRLSVGGTADFSDCEFDEIPDFRDAKLERPPEVASMQVPAPKLEGILQTSADKEDVGKLRKLKAMAIVANDHEMDGYFFALEMMAKRGTETKGFFPLLFNSLYGWLSDYGQSFLRPITGLAISWLAFAELYFIMLNARVAEPLASYFSAEYSFRHVVPLLSSLFRFAPSPSPIGSQPEFQTGFQQRFTEIYAIVLDIDWFTYVSIFQQFVGAVLLFLLLLALRNKFRLK